MSAASAFSNWLSLNREAILTGPKDIVNDVSKRSYLMATMLRGRKLKGDIIRSGTYITERVKLHQLGSFRSYIPGETRSPSRNKTIETINYGWRFHESDVPYTDAEIDLSQGDRLTIYKNFEHSIMMDLKQDHLDGLEESWWRKPNQTTMDTQSTQGGDMYSIPAWVVEDDTYMAPGWTTSLGGIGPAAVDNWRNARETYLSSAFDDPDTGLFQAMDLMSLDIRFEAVPNFTAYMESDNLNKLCIATNKDGRAKFSGLCRSGNDRFRAGPQDPAYGSPVWQGVPVKYFAELDTVELDQSSGSYTSQAYPAGKPRYFFLNFKYLYPVFHSSHFLEVTDPIKGGITQRDAWAIFMVSWCNLVCRSRRRQGIVYPSDA